MYIQDFEQWLIKKVRANSIGAELKSIEIYPRQLNVATDHYDDIMELSKKHNISPSDVLWLIIDYGFNLAERYIEIIDYENSSRVF